MIYKYNDFIVSHFLDFMILGKLKFATELISEREKIIFSHHQGSCLEAPQYRDKVKRMVGSFSW